VRGDDVHTAAADGSGVKNVTKSGEDEELPSISPNGKLIAYTLDSNSRKRPFGVYVRTISGKKLTHLTADAERKDKYISAHGASWAPDGKKIAFACLIRATVVEVCTVDTKGKFKRLTACACVFLQYPVEWSSKNRIAFHARDGLFTVGSKGGAPKLLAADTTAGDGSWKPDGSEFWYACSTGDICAVGAGGGQPQKIWDAFHGEGNPGSDTALDDPAWGPDGTKVLVALREASFPQARPDGLYVWDPATSELQPVTTRPFKDFDGDWGPAPR
jgi:Tol biopolymer transport system component